MIHIRLTGIDGTVAWLAQIGPYGSWGDLQWTTRWGDGASGMYEASWTMPLPPGFDHPLLRRGTMVELMDGPWRIGSPLILDQIARGAGYDQPWTLTCSGIGREVEGESSFYALDGSGDSTTIGTTAVDTAIANGWRVDGRDASIPASGPSASSTSDDLKTVGTLLGLIGDESNGKRWGVGQDNLVRLMADPTTPTYFIVPDSSALGTDGSAFASTVLFRYRDDVTHAYATKTATDPDTEARYGHREFPVDRTDLGEIPAAVAQAFADGILAKSKGRVGWSNGLTLTSQQILTAGGGEADLSKVSEDVAEGCMVEFHGIFNDLLELTGQLSLTDIVGEAKYADGAPTIQLNPLGLAPDNMAAVIEAVSGPRAA